jgi:hypothetical protein
VTIPGLGDLSPPRRQLPIGRWVVTVVVLLLLAGGGYAAFLGLSGGSSKPTASQLPLCPLPTTLPTLPPVSHQALRLTVKNGTERNGLAASVSSALEERGFNVTSIGNTASTITGVATVRYSKDRLAVAERVAAEIKGSTLVVAGGHGVVELDIGPKYHRLSTRPQARAALIQLVAPSAAASPTPTTSCRPRD